MKLNKNYRIFQREQQKRKTIERIIRIDNRDN
jgi:hypothetical protein